jgi:ACT domain-containing protein
VLITVGTAEVAAKRRADGEAKVTSIVTDAVASVLACEEQLAFNSIVNQNVLFTQESRKGRVNKLIFFVRSVFQLLQIAVVFFVKLNK